MIQMLKYLLDFLKHPTYYRHPNQKIPFKLKWLLFLLVVELPIMFILTYLIDLLSNLGILNLEEHLIYSFLKDSSPLLILFSVVIFGPILEELFFRLPLRLTRSNLLTMLILGMIFFVIILFSIKYLIPTWLIISLLTIILLLIISVYFRNVYLRIVKFYRKYFILIFYVVAFIFGFIHITNYPFTWKLLLFAPLIILPQLIAGLILGFIRLKFGFFLGFLLHGLHNLILIFPVIYLLNSPLKTIMQVEKDGYYFIVEQGKKPFYSDRKITSKEIALNSDLKMIISDLTGFKKRHIKVSNEELLLVDMHLYLRNDSAISSDNTKEIQALALKNLLKAYQLNLTEEKKQFKGYTIVVSDSAIFNSKASKSEIAENEFKLKSFMHKNDTLKYPIINSLLLSKILESNFEYDVTSSINDSIHFSIQIPNSSISELKEYFKSDYGIQLKDTMLTINSIRIK